MDRLLNPNTFWALSEAFGINRGPCMSLRESSRPASVVTLHMLGIALLAIRLSRVLHGRPAGRALLRCEKISGLARLCRSSSDDLGGESSFGWRCSVLAAEARQSHTLRLPQILPV